MTLKWSILEGCYWLNACVYVNFSCEAKKKTDVSVIRLLSLCCVVVHWTACDQYMEIEDEIISKKTIRFFCYMNMTCCWCSVTRWATISVTFVLLCLISIWHVSDEFVKFRMQMSSIELKSIESALWLFRCDIDSDEIQRKWTAIHIDMCMDHHKSGKRIYFDMILCIRVHMQLVGMIIA